MKRITDLDRFVQNLYDELCELEDFELNSSAPVFHIPPKEYDSVRQMMIPVGECYCILDGNNSRIFCKRKTISTINGLSDRIKEFNMIKNVEDRDEG